MTVELTFLRPKLLNSFPLNMLLEVSLHQSLSVKINIDCYGYNI